MRKQNGRCDTREGSHLKGETTGMPYPHIAKKVTRCNFPLRNMGGRLLSGRIGVCCQERVVVEVVSEIVGKLMSDCGVAILGRYDVNDADLDWTVISILCSSMATMVQE